MTVEELFLIFHPGKQQSNGSKLKMISCVPQSCGSCSLLSSSCWMSHTSHTLCSLPFPAVLVLIPVQCPGLCCWIRPRHAPFASGYSPCRQSSGMWIYLSLDQELCLTLRAPAGLWELQLFFLWCSLKPFSCGITEVNSHWFFRKTFETSSCVDKEPWEVVKNSSGFLSVLQDLIRSFSVAGLGCAPQTLDVLPKPNSSTVRCFMHLFL